ncbi:MAG: sugar phosphate isomerase/epimerase, partial [Planctomycetes bacterium]|nr:sugar phosphate isomerase/epimerase [Planctomycetota bacterium]
WLLGCRSTNTPPEPWFEISLAQWSLHRRLRGEQQPSIDNLEFAATARGFGIDAIEYVNQFFVDKATDDAYLAEMVRRADGEGVRSLLIMVDGEGALGAPDVSHRAKSVERHVRWLHAASALGCHSIRVNAASEGTYEQQMQLAADGLRRLCQRADEFDLGVIVENHGGLSSNGSWLAEVIRRADHPRAGTLPDFGNFRISGDDWYDRYRGVEEMMPFARAVSAKSHDFDANGDETHTDFERMLRIVLDAGYRGYVGIEYEGAGLEDDGIRATKALLERVRARIVA